MQVVSLIKAPVVPPTSKTNAPPEPFDLFMHRILSYVTQRPLLQFRCSDLPHDHKIVEEARSIAHHLLVWHSKFLPPDIRRVGVAYNDKYALDIVVFELREKAHEMEIFEVSPNPGGLDIETYVDSIPNLKFEDFRVFLK